MAIHSWEWRRIASIAQRLKAAGRQTDAEVLLFARGAALTEAAMRSVLADAETLKEAITA